MATLLVDTDVYSYIRSSNPQRGAPYRPYLEGNIIALSFITIGEQYAGYQKKIGRGDWSLAHLKKFEDGLAQVLIVPYDIEVCRTYGRLKAELKNLDGSSRVVAPNDLWIAACAVRHSLTLVTNNRKDFDGIPGLTLICEAPAKTDRKGKMAEGGGVGVNRL